MKIYKSAEGFVANAGGPMTIIVEDDKSHEGYWLPHIERHSPDGFQWGYEGSGPADLALAILADFLDGDKRQATIFYQDFKRDFVAKMASDKPFHLLGDVIGAWLSMKWQKLNKETGAVIPDRFKMEGVKTNG